MKLVEINDSQFDNLVLRSSLPVMLLCTSPECIICKTMIERITEAGKAHWAKMLFLKLNVNDNKRWQDFKVRVIPTLLYFKDGVLVTRQDNFPEVEDIQAQVRILAKKRSGVRRHSGKIQGGQKSI